MSFRDVQARHRYELDHDGGTSFAEYRIDEDGRRALTHFETPEKLRGKGGAAKLMQAILENAREDNIRLRARCPYADNYLESNPDAGDVMVSGTGTD